eukprot:2416988-Rhodomonas_salina.1
MSGTCHCIPGRPPVGNILNALGRTSGSSGDRDLPVEVPIVAVVAVRPVPPPNVAAQPCLAVRIATEAHAGAAEDCGLEVKDAFRALAHKKDRLKLLLGPD